ncbi:hypothetical protein RhiJN_15050 [Ceratobasidium sp. AG-Ba]|nr:hypothetical protein RhiJN_15050 [Ceratobasidium sp. AG-Ba]
MERPERTQPRFLSPDVEKALRSVVLDYKATGKAVDLLIDYEAEQPPEKAIDSDEPALLHFLDLNVDNVAAHVGLPKLPEAFYDYLHSDHIDWTPGELMSYLDRGGLMDPKTGQIYGGYSGVIRLLIVAHLMTKTIRWGLGQHISPDDSYIDFNSHLPQVVAELMAWIVSAISRLINRTTSSKKVGLPAKSQRSVWIPKSVITHRPNGPDHADEAGWFRYEPVLFQHYMKSSVQETEQVVELEGSDRDPATGSSVIKAQEQVPVVGNTPVTGDTNNDNLVNVSPSSSSDGASAATKLRPITVEGMPSLGTPKLIDTKSMVDKQTASSGTSESVAPALQAAGEQNPNPEAQNQGATVEDMEASAPSETVTQPPIESATEPSQAAVSSAGPSQSSKHRRSASSVSTRATTRRSVTYGSTTRRAPSGSLAPSVASSSRATSISRDNYLTRATQHVASTRQGMNVSSALAASVVPSRRKDKRPTKQEQFNDSNA